MTPSIDILQNVMLPYAEDEMAFIWVLQQDNDPEHTSKKAKKWFADNIINIIGMACTVSGSQSNWEFVDWRQNGSSHLQSNI